jgi:protein xylosyltransferase
MSPVVLIDHNDDPISSQPALAALDAACHRAIDRVLGAEGELGESAATEDVSLVATTETPPPGGVSIAYLIMGHRSYAHITISRLIQVLWHAAHLFVVHLDARTDAAVANTLEARYRPQSNVRFIRQRRTVGWGAFSMVEVLLAALSKALLAAPHFDFFVNLSDADVALRTASELGSFLGGFRGRSFVAIKYPEADAMRYQAHAHMRSSTWLECEGEGFLVINQTAAHFFGAEGRRCCFARSGPIVYGPLAFDRPPPPEAVKSFYHGSQWVVLDHDAADWLVHSSTAVELAAHLRHTYMADEAFVQTALMASPLKGRLINHNLRYIDWPHGYGDPNAYWRRVGTRHVAGPIVLTRELFRSVTRSPAIFARKVDAEDAEGIAFVREWDVWMAAKHLVERSGADVSTEVSSSAAGDTELASSGAGDTELASYGARDADRTNADVLAAAKRLLSSIGQPPIATTLLAEDETLTTMRPPLSPEERKRVAADLTAEEAAHVLVSRPVHFGHEDLMAKQFEQPREAQFGKFERPRLILTALERPLIEGGIATASPEGVNGVTYGVNGFSSPLPIPLDAAGAVGATGHPLQQSRGAPPRAELPAFTVAEPSAPRLARMVFSDGSSCSCAAWCSRESKRSAEPCCTEWVDACAWEAVASGSNK